MNTGQIISAAGHAGLILWAVLGGTFSSAPPPYEVREVTAISAEDYAALIAARRAPEAVASVDTPEPPEAGAAPSVASQADAPPEQDRPPETDTAEPDPAPEPPEPAPAEPAEVTDAPPVLQPPADDTAVLVPEIAETPRLRPAPRVAPEPVARPEPDAEVDEVDRAATAPDESAETVEDDRRETAREEAATEIVTEAEKSEDAAAPARSLRPRPRPARAEEPVRTAAAPQPAAETAPRVDDAAVEDAIAAALGAAGAGTGDTGTPSGPPLTAGEKDALRVAVQQCWNVGSLSTEALATTVVVTVSMFEDGRPDAASIRMTGYSGGGAEAADHAFGAARRAIIRCGANGYDLPFGKYDRWRSIEMTFNPERMRIK